VVAIYNPPGGYLALYTNGVLVAMNSAVTVPLSSVSSVLNYIGRSLYTTDPYPDLSLDEFRIYNGVLHADDIAATQVLGPNQLLSASSPIINSSLIGGNLTLSWPLASAGFTLMSRTNLASGIWATVSPTAQMVGSNGRSLCRFPAMPSFSDCRNKQLRVENYLNFKRNSLKLIPSETK